MARMLPTVAAVVGAAAGTAIAQSEDPYALPEPPVRDVDGLRTLELTGIPRAASAMLRLQRGSSRVLVRGKTLGGQRVRVARTYRTCDPHPRPNRRRSTGPLQEGGGED